MTENTGTTAGTIAPPLDDDLGSVDTSFPIIKPTKQVEEVRCENAEVKTTAKGGFMIKVQWATLIPHDSMPDAAGMTNVINPGATVFDQILNVPSGKMTWDQVKKAVGALVQSVPGFSTNVRDAVGPGAQNQCQNAAAWVGLLKGKVARVKIGYEPAGSKDGKSFNAKNTIEAYIKAA